eukprot:321053-Hanusia_phi.AAC.1
MVLGPPGALSARTLSRAGLRRRQAATELSDQCPIGSTGSSSACHGPPGRAQITESGAGNSGTIEEVLND